MGSPLVEAAAIYLGMGLAVIALNGKMPNGKVHRHGKDEPLVGAPESDEDWDLISGAFDHPDTTGIGILTGRPYVVVDIDGEEGAEQWVDIVGDYGLYEEARWVAKTGRGLHLWYNPGLSLLRPTEEGFVGPPTIKLGAKLDLKGFGGYVAAPPSRHPDGGSYEWLVAPRGDAPLEIPDALRERIEDHMFDQQGKLDAKIIRRQAWGPKYVEGATTFYAQASHDALIEGMTKAGEGNRNNYLHWAAATLTEEGGSDEEFAMLAEAALAVGLEPIEVKRTVRSARRAGV